MRPASLPYHGRTMMRFTWYLCSLVLSVSPASGRTEYRLGGGDGNPWQSALSTENAGTYRVLDAQGQQVRSVPPGLRVRWGLLSLDQMRRRQARSA